MLIEYCIAFLIIFWYDNIRLCYKIWIICRTIVSYDLCKILKQCHLMQKNKRPGNWCMQNCKCFTLANSKEMTNWHFEKCVPSIYLKRCVNLIASMKNVPDNLCFSFIIQKLDLAKHKYHVYRSYVTNKDYLYNWNAYFI